MNISLDEQIRKDKERDRLNSRHYVNIIRISVTKKSKQPQSKIKFIFRIAITVEIDSNAIKGKIDLIVNNALLSILQIFIILLPDNNFKYSAIYLQELCEKFGNVKSCRIEWDKMGRSNVCIFIFRKKQMLNTLVKLNLKLLSKN